MKRLLVTGSGGLVGSACVRYFCERGWDVRGIDNNSRSQFFGEETLVNRVWGGLESEFVNFRNHFFDITEISRVEQFVDLFRPDAIIHAAAQPSHDLAAKIPMRDFDVNARATLGLLNAARSFVPGSTFVYLSTDKVYGDWPNEITAREDETRYRWGSETNPNDGWSELETVDQVTHSVFGCSKLAADMYVQEFGRAGWLKTACLRAGCLTGGDHAGVELHGFLSYLSKCIVRGLPYKIHGFKGKQVRDNLHADDVAAFCGAFIEKPTQHDVYNLGGGYGNTCSVVEAIAVMEEMVGHPFKYDVSDTVRRGDHCVYYSDLTKCRTHFPQWRVTRDLPSIYDELVRAWSDL